MESSKEYDPLAQVVLYMSGLVNPWHESCHFPPIPLSLAFFPTELGPSLRILLNTVF